MDINVKVTLDASPELKAILQGLFKPLAGGVAATSPAPTASGKNKLKNSDKVEKTTTPEPEPEPEPAADAPTEVEDTTDASADDVTETSGEPSVTIEQIRALIPGAKAKVGTDKVKALLTKYDTANVTNLPKAKYDEFYNELKNLAA